MIQHYRLYVPHSELRRDDMQGLLSGQEEWILLLTCNTTWQSMSKPKQIVKRKRYK